MVCFKFRSSLTYTFSLPFIYHSILINCKVKKKKSFKMIRIVLVDYGKTISNYNEKILSTDIDHERKCISRSLVIYIL